MSGTRQVIRVMRDSVKKEAEAAAAVLIGNRERRNLAHVELMHGFRVLNLPQPSWSNLSAKVSRENVQFLTFSTAN